MPLGDAGRSTWHDGGREKPDTGGRVEVAGRSSVLIAGLAGGRGPWTGGAFPGGAKKGLEISFPPNLSSSVADCSNFPEKGSFTMNNKTEGGRGSGPGGGGGALPGGPASHDPDLVTLVRKLIRRYYRDLMLRIPPQFRFLVPISLLLLAVLVVAPIAYLSRSGDGSLFGLSRPKATKCRCPVYGDVTYLQNQLGSARTVFRARIDGPSKDKKLVIVTIEEIYRGPPRLSDYRVALPVEYAHMCNTRSVPKEVQDENPNENSFIIAANLVSGASISQRSSADDAEKALLFGLAGPLDCGGILIIPVKALAWDVLETLTSEGSLMETWWRFDEFNEKNRTLRLVESEWWMREGTSLVAACRNQPTCLVTSLKNWVEADDIDEIILVDWSSTTRIFDVLNETAPDLLQNEKLNIVVVTGQSAWSETISSNIGIRLATRSKVLRVNCDTLLSKDFVPEHPLNSQTIYRAPTSEDNFLIRDRKMLGLIFARRIDVLAVNGFDERISSFGYADMDLSSRVSIKRLVTPAFLNDSFVDVVAASPGDEDTRVFSVLKRGDPYAEEVETKRNRILLTKDGIPSWGLWSRNVLFNTKPKFVPISSGTEIDAIFRTYEPQKYEDSVGEAGVQDATIRALKFALHMLGAPAASSASYSKDFFATMVTYQAAPENYATLLVRFKGGCAARVLAFASLRAMLSARNSTDGPRIRDRLLWEKDDLCACKFTSIVARGDIEIYDKSMIGTGITSGAIFSENIEYEAVTDVVSIRDRPLGFNSTTPLDLRCLMPRADQLKEIEAVRQELANLLPPEETRSKSGSDRKSYTAAANADTELGLDRAFLKTWQGSQNPATYEKNFKRLDGRDKSIRDDIAFRARLLHGCGESDSVQDIFKTFPELTAMFAFLWTPQSRCLGATRV